MQQSIAANASLAKAGRSALLSFAALLIALPIGTTAAFAQLRGHGGPVRALAISADGQSAISGSFDSTAIRWSLTRNAAEQVLRFHADAVNAVALLGDGRAATAGADGRIAIWTSGQGRARRGAGRPYGADRRAGGIARRRNARIGLVGSHGAALAARRRRAARARRAYAERQRRGVYRRWPRPGQRQLRPQRSHLAAVGRANADRRCDADPAQRRGRRRRW